MDFTPVCKKCGKKPPVDKKMSTQNWTVYITKHPCKCGGEWTSKFIYEADKKNGQ